jgi:two-component system alkaline phosphatase synthesis response regulator PhoP
VLVSLEKILIIEDESDVAELLAYNLAREGYQPFVAHEGVSGLQRSQEFQPDLVILDLMLPGIDGWEVFRRLKKERETAHTPVIMLTARGDEADRVLGLELGADDYITKPFSLREVMARIKTVLRRKDSERDRDMPEVIQSGQLRIDRGRFEVTVKGKAASLTTKEFELLYTLAANRGRVLSRDRLLDLVWGHEEFVEPRTVDVHITRLRGKLMERFGSGGHIETVRGIGYRFRDMPADLAAASERGGIHLPIVARRQRGGGNGSKAEKRM